ncbi:hypothetical protein [Pseudomonas capsici]|uniref:hypothetical protein n=1 Tax=Pseudomonas capsici TaxID=2810614 RepID=UPI0021F1F019|nr:hypothetical protein [Pseudomonas capsici]MCV4343264.1 hypothetical protein [Pseudomonas capsici]
MISMELSSVQHNTAKSAELSAAVDDFLARGGTVSTLQGFVQRPRQPDRAYGRSASIPSSSAKAGRARKGQKKGVQVSTSVKDQVRQIAETMALAQARKETGLSTYMLNRIADEGNFQFQKPDCSSNLIPYKKDPVEDALNVIRIKNARDRGLSKRAALKELSISNTLMRRLIAEFSIDYPAQARK